MEELLHAFGIDAKLIVIQIINFVVLAAALSYLLYKPVLKLLDEREAKIKQGLKDAADAAEARASAETDRKSVLEAAHRDATEINARASESAKASAAEIVRAAEEKAAGMIRTAEERGNELRERARAESEAEITKLAVLAAEKVLRERAS